MLRGYHIITFSLPSSVSAVWLRSFWLVISLSSGLLVGVLSALIFSPSWCALGIAVALGLALPGLLRPQIASIPYRAWNTLARTYTHYAYNGLLRIWFYIVFVAVGHSRASSLKLARLLTVESFWIPRGVQAVRLSHDSQHTTIEEALHRSWVPAFLAWATSTRNWWAYCLLPFFMLLVSLVPELEDNASLVDIYPLF